MKKVIKRVFGLEYITFKVMPSDNKTNAQREPKKRRSNIFKHWVSTLCGVLLGALNLALTKDVTTSTIVMSAGTAVLGAVVKDPDLLGGNE